MQRLLICLAVLISGMAPGEAQPQSPYTPASLAVELHRLQSVLNSGSNPQIPSAWEVATPERRYSISTQPLNALLHAERSPRDSGNRQAKAWLDMLAQQLDGYESAPTVADARARLDRILARHEFSGVRPPSSMELWRRKIVAWFQGLLRRFFTVAAGHPTAIQVLFWLVASGCVGFLAVWLVHWWTRDRLIPALPPPDHAEIAGRSWQQWRAAAQHAAEQHDWRQAIHCAYWVAILTLQQSGSLPEDGTRTPREYLHLFSAPAGHGPLAALTSGLERFWYAQRNAGPEDYRESLNHLEALGCKLE